MTEAEKKEPRLVSRRSFLGKAGIAAVGGVMAAPQLLAPAAATAAIAPSPVPSAPVEQVGKSYPASQAYLLVDSKKCAGCQTCMLACSMVHEGVANPTLSRIQVTQNPFLSFPYDLQVAQCRQCTTPVCVQNCPTGACHVDTTNGNLRVIDQEQCIGCQTCLSSCPQVPHRTVWNPETRKAAKCDLCANAPFMEGQGGPDGTQACVSACTMGALKVVKEIPSQLGTSGYDVNLRTS